MCGIAGIVVGPTSGRQADEACVLRMRDSLVHRGPDDAGLYLGRGVALGHRRLSIVDVSHGHQPMTSDDGHLHVVYNGEVFNHPTLKADLESRGVVYRTRSDTETVLRLFEAERQHSVKQMRGMFAIALWDDARRELFLARDRFGVKPLYYAHLADGTLLFASEIKGILASGMVTPTLNRRALPDYLANYAPSGNETLFEGILRLPAGHTLIWRDGTIAISQYWELPVSNTDTLTGTDSALVAEYSERFTEAVRLRLMSDVPLGMFLSGGIDSAAITAVMSELVSEPIKTFSVAFAEREANEFAYARMVAEKFKTSHHEVVVSPDEFFTALPRLVWHEDEPIAHPSSVALYFVSKLASEQVKVVLTGEGSDEVLAGYNRYRMTLLNSRFGGAYQRSTPAIFRSAVRSGLAGLAPHMGIARKLTRTFLSLDTDLDTLYFDNFAVFGRRWQQRLLSPDVRAELGDVDPYAAAHRAFDQFPSASLLQRLLFADTKTYLQELLMKQDQMSMAASIESRVPFLDHPLAEWASRLPEHLRLQGLTTKVILRKAMAGRLPEEILSRKKMGFPVPIGAWVRGPYRHLLDEFVLSERARSRALFDADTIRQLVADHQAGRANHAERLWMLMNFEIWQRIAFDGEAIDRVMPVLSRRAAA